MDLKSLFLDNPRRKKIYIEANNGIKIGFTEVELTSTLNADGTVVVSEDASRRATIPSDHAHDLAPVYGNPDELWITTGSNVYRYNKVTKTFFTEYDGYKYLNRSSVKGVGNFEDGSLVFLYPDGAFQSWTTKSMILVQNQDGKMVQEVLKSETGHFYKVRVWDTRYQ